MNCYQFLKQYVEERKKFVQNKKLCKNCLSKGHQLDASPSKFTCRKDGSSQKHHTLLHENKTNELVSNRLESSNSKASPSTFLQIIPVTLISGKRAIKTKALLDTGSDSTFITTDITKQLCLKEIDQEISLSNVMSSKKTFQSKLVNLEISSNSNSEKFKTKNVWVVNSMKLPPKCLNLDKVKD